jgi:hypothetical protein
LWVNGLKSTVSSIFKLATLNNRGAIWSISPATTYGIWWAAE